MHLDEVTSDDRGHPFAMSVAALVHVLVGDVALARTEADKVSTTAGATYLDKVLAGLALAGVHQRTGDLPAARSAAAAASEVAENSGDLVASALASTVRARLDGASVPAGVTPLADGWQHVAMMLIP